MFQRPASDHTGKGLNNATGRIPVQKDTCILALKEEGWSVNDSAIRLGLEALERLAIKDARGKRIQSTVSPAWDTVLMMVGLADSGLAGERLDVTVQWVKKQLHFGPNGDWRIYNLILPLGGWSFQYYNTWCPDTDDTAVAILALIKTDPQCVGSFSIHRATQWILGMQNRDGGWGAFGKENNKLFLNKTLLGDMDNLCDPSTADITGRIL
jgi:squalene-hopene/tetraprenyl-beta-curcumene cyclase